MKTKKEVIIFGAGAAGMMCAIEAGKKNRKVLILEKSEKPGKKILISGGGRCNFTNINASHENFISGNPHFSKSALAGFTPDDFILLVKKYGISFHEKKLGQLFCNGSSKQIVNMLLEECRINGVEIFSDCNVTSVKKNSLFEVESDKGVFECESLVIATGGISIPKMGATGFGYEIAKKFGHKVTHTRPGLVPIKFRKKEKEIYSELSGISIDCIASIGKINFRENLLFTHNGLSGPAILQISSYLKSGESFSANMLPDRVFADLLDSNRDMELSSLLSKFLPDRFAKVFCNHIYKSKKIKTISKKDIAYLLKSIHSWQIITEGTEGFDKAEVTVGGIDTNELSSKTMESNKVKGLYFIGEVVDVTGWLGGYNFQWAWSSGHAAGKNV